MTKLYIYILFKSVNYFCNIKINHLLIFGTPQATKIMFNDKFNVLLRALLWKRDYLICIFHF